MASIIYFRLKTHIKYQNVNINLNYTIDLTEYPNIVPTLK